ncbi:nuclease HARBI1 [Trichonephila clavata]|uniref:Nuclease HARBI1 n=1 Tax=Trichonephila clavata TaxID=2740835 RepID=A0A8X6KT17_TRICU|nr:nuclease HARBI1 [Trichonephila clavata]
MGVQVSLESFQCRELVWFGSKSFSSSGVIMHAVCDACHAQKKDSICLRYLITGHSFTSLTFYYRVGLSTIHEIVRETTQALWNALQPRYMAIPSTDEWSKIAQDYKYKWNMPNYIGSIDGKQCSIQRPCNAGSLFL